MYSDENGELETAAYVLSWFNDESEKVVIAVHTNMERAELNLAKAYMAERDKDEDGAIYKVFCIDAAPLYLDVPKSA